jgi:hypothetical protein
MHSRALSWTALTQRKGELGISRRSLLAIPRGCSWDSPGSVRVYGRIDAIGIDIDIDYTEYCNYGFAFGLELLLEIASTVSDHEITLRTVSIPTQRIYTIHVTGTGRAAV